MSRTFKDTPYLVQARRNGDVSTFPGHHTITRDRTITCIFYAHEMREMERFENACVEAGVSFHAIETHGLLVIEHDHSLYSRWNRKPRWKEPLAGYYHPERVAVVHSKPADTLWTLYSVNKKVNVFYVYTVTVTYTRSNTHVIINNTNTTLRYRPRCNCEYCTEGRTRYERHGQQLDREAQHELMDYLYGE